MIEAALESHRLPGLNEVTMKREIFLKNPPYFKMLSVNGHLLKSENNKKSTGQGVNIRLVSKSFEKLGL